MKRLFTAAHFGARLAWLWRHRRKFGDWTLPNQPRLLVDVSEIIRHDAQTGIQRVVRAVWLELQRRDGNGFTLVPVYATRSHGYCYAPANFLDFPRIGDLREPVRVHSGDRFLGLDLSAHVLPKYRLGDDVVLFTCGGYEQFAVEVRRPVLMLREHSLHPRRVADTAM